MKKFEMTKERFIREMNNIKAYYNELEKRNDLLDEIYEDSFVIESLGTVLMADYVNLLSDLIGDVEIINWYIYDCEFGDTPLELEIEGWTYLVDSLDILWDIIK